MVFREAVPGDADAIARLKVGAWRAAYDERLTAGLDGRIEAAEWRAYLEERPGEDRLWVAEDGGALLGYARTSPGEVRGLYVDPDRIGTGLGHALFRYAVDDLRLRGSRSVVVWHFVGNDRAARFYAREGMRFDDGRRPSDFGVDEVRWRLEL